MDVRLPDGTVIQNVPDGTTKADLVAKLQKNGMAVPADWLAPAAPKPAERSVVQKVGDEIRDIPRQVGLTARYAAEAATGLADTFASPIRGALNMIPGVNIQPAATTVGQLADKAGISPRDANERVIGDITRAGFGAGGFVGGANALSQAATGTAKAVTSQLAANPLTQVVGGAAAGGAGGAVREAGGGPVEQFIAALVGGVAGGMAANKAGQLAESASNAIRRAAAPQQATQAADQQIQIALERSGVDWAQVPERVRQGLRQEVADALNTGGTLNPDALRRLLAFRSTETTPTVGMLTQNPGQITREANLAKTGANSTDASLQRLPALQNQNVQTLLRRLDEAGAARAPDAATAGARAMAGLQARATEARGNIDRLYGAARDTQGRSLPLNGNAFTTQANQMLDDAMVGGALPADVANTMNRIARGEMPFTVEIAEQLKTRIGALQRGSSDGSARMALGIVRQALDEAPLVPPPSVNPGNLPVAPGALPQSNMAAGQQSIDAFNQARAANRSYMQMLEANPALAAVDEAMAAVRSNPGLRSVEDVVGSAGFMSKYVLGKSATPGQVRTLIEQVGPEGAQALRQNVIRYLRDAATNSTDDVAKFSNDAYRRALRDIGDEKLLALFSPEEVLNLRNIGQAAKYMQAQPAGSAVNNSNSGAMVIGRGLDILDRAAAYVPLGGRDILRGYIQGAQQGQVLTPRNALVDAARAPESVPSRMVVPLLAAPLAVQPGQDDRRR